MRAITLVPLASWLIASIGCSSTPERGSVHASGTGSSGASADAGQEAAVASRGSPSAGDTASGSGGNPMSNAAVDKVSSGRAANTPADAGVDGSGGAGHTPIDAGVDAAAQKPCPLDQNGVPSPEVKACQVDADCTIVRTFGCCGPGIVYGLAKAAQADHPACFMESHPHNCPPLACQSQTSTEDEQYASGPPSDPIVLSRCFDVEGGHRACYTTVPGSCVHNVTRCSAGDTCTNACGVSCTCTNSYITCPLAAGPCVISVGDSLIPACDYRSTPNAPFPSTRCLCSESTNFWECTA